MLLDSPRWVALAASCLSLLACGSDPEPAPEPSAFTLTFEAKAGDVAVDCDHELGGLGPDGEHSLSLADLRFYVSNLRFSDRNGNPVVLSLDENDFQYTSDNLQSVALIDMTGNDSGSCAGNASAFSEGTARTNFAVTGKTLVDEVNAVSFEVGVPQGLMREVIANHSAEGAPSPLNEMQWSWASGYRHFVMNFGIKTESADEGGGNVHVGSRDCGPADGLALEDRDACDYVNTPQVSLTEFDLNVQRVVLDVPSLLAGLDFVSNIYDPETFDVLGEGPGVECHSSPTQPDCATVFANLGINAEDGTADASQDGVFRSE